MDRAKDSPKTPHTKPASLPRFRRHWQRRELLLLGTFALLPFLANWLISPVAAVEALLLAIGGSFVVVLLRGNWRLFGPHFYYDVIRLARRGRSTGVRIVYVTALLGGLAYIYSEYFGRRGQFLEMLFEPGIGVSRNRMAQLAETFVMSTIILQNFAVLLLTPAYVATALTEERERRTLDLLFTSHLNDREIVLGKLMARLVHMGGVLLAGLPILSLAQFFGGVDMIVLLGNFATTALNLWTVGVICIMSSALARSAVTAVLASLGTLIPLVFCFSCSGAMHVRYSLLLISQRELGGDYVHLLEIIGAALVLHGAVSLVCLSIAMRNLRSDSDLDVEANLASFRDLYYYYEAPEARKAGNRELALEERIVLREGRAGVRHVEGDPLLWKEVHTGGPLLAAIFWLPLASLLFPLVMIFLAVVLGNWFNEYEVRALHGLAMTMVIGVAGLFCLGTAFRTCISVARERQQGTLDALLTLPVNNRDILKAKWLGALYKGWVWGVFYLVILLMGVAGGAMHVLGGLLLILAPIVHAAFLASLGLFLSVVSRNVLAAQTKLALILLVLLVVNLAAMETFRDLIPEWADFCVCMNPPMCWYALCTSPLELNGLRPGPGQFGHWQFGHWVVMILLSLVIYAAATGGLWLLTCRLFALERFRRRT